MEPTASISSRSTPCEPTILGIWRVGATLHESPRTKLALSQPADAAGSPRWDYVIKRAIAGNDDWESRRQIVQFIAAATAVSHPNLIPVLDGSATAPTPYLVMPRLEGETMQHHLTCDQATPLPVAIWFVRQAAQALHFLHHAGWIHGDVKPANLMVGTLGHVTLVDLGFASRIHTAPSHRYRGTPAYSAPESLSGELAAIPQMDIFSLGRILWQWMTRTGQVHRSLLEPVADLVQSMVANDPNERPTAATVVKQLLRLEIETLGRHIGPVPVSRAA
jgi:serine/threonine protein kinase